MFKNFVKIAFRSFYKRKGYTLINILGLASGIAVCMLILLFIQHEMNYDRFHKESGRIYRMVVDRKYPGRTTSYSFIPQSYASAARREYPEVKEALRIYNFLGGSNFLVKYGDKTFEEKRVLIADSNFFKVFRSEIIAGDRTDPLLKANSVVINETTAKKYFSSPANAPGKMLQPQDNDAPLMVTAVIRDWPENSHFNFDLLMTTAGNQFATQTNFVNFSAHTYLLLEPNINPQQLTAKFPALIEKYASADIEQQFAQNYKQFQTQGNGYHYYLQPLETIHLESNLEGELSPNGSLQALYIFSLVAVFILALACINFINLSTARSVERAREVGIRKTFGSEKKALITQFLTESVILSIISTVIAIAVLILLLPFFNQLTNKHFTLAVLFSREHLLILVSMAIGTGLLAGIYPALVLSSFKPILVLKGKFKTSGHGMLLRNSLVVFQFAISVILIICTVTVRSQMEYMTNEKLGFNKEQLIAIERSDLLEIKTNAFKNELLKIKGIKSASGASALPGETNYFGISWKELSQTEYMTGRGLMADEKYLSTLGLELKAGRFFSKEFPTDTFAVVLNEKAVKDLGLKDPIGATLVSPDEFISVRNGVEHQFTVIGVVKDYHYQSLHQTISPLVITNSAIFNDNMNVLAVRISEGYPTATIQAIESTWKKFVPERPFHYTFLDNTIARQYEAETTLLKVFSFFSSFAIFIACIGLLGLIAYSIQQKTHEISIRKILGANPGSIMQLLSKDFIRLVVIASLLAFPVSWYIMHLWLQDFVYRVNISIWVFLLAALTAIIITLITISFQAIRAALANPVKTLRTE